MATTNTTASTNNNTGELLRRVLMGLLVFAIFMALSLLLPRTLPGELSRANMTSAPSTCTTCPPDEQITAGGMIATEDGTYVNVRFATAPLNTRLKLSFAGTRDEWSLSRSAGAWRTEDGLRPSPELVDVAQRDNTVVLRFPAALRARGFAVRTESGDRFPSEGFASVQYPGPARFNVTDVVLLLALGLTAWYGAIRGFVLELADMAVLVTGFAIAAIVHRPLASVLASMTDSAASAAAVSGGLTVVVVVFAGVFIVRRNLTRIGRISNSFDAQSNVVLGAAAGCLRQLPVLAMLLVFGTKLAALSWASHSINSSVLGGALIHAWRSVFTV